MRRDPRRSRRLGQRPVRGRGGPAQRGHRGRGRPAALPGHRLHPDRRRPGPPRRHGRPGRGGPGGGRVARVPDAQPALFHHGPAHGHGRGQHRHEPAGPGRPPGRRPGGEYRFFFVAKGGGSSNKIALFQESKARLEDGALEAFLADKIRALGVAACPPYRIAVVVGGLSPGVDPQDGQAGLGRLPRRPAREGRPRKARPSATSAGRSDVMRLARETGLGAQFGGALSGPRGPLRPPAAPRRVVPHRPRRVLQRRPRPARQDHAPTASSSKRSSGDPARFLEGATPAGLAAAVAVDLDRPMAEILAKLRAASPSAPWSGCRARSSSPATSPTPGWPGCSGRRATFPTTSSATPSITPARPRRRSGMASGGFGPTTAQRMDGYLAEFLKAGPRSFRSARATATAAAVEALKAGGGVFLGTIGGAAALIAKEHIVSSETIDFADLGMEAVRRIVVRDLPAFVIYDGQGRRPLRSRPLRGGGGRGRLPARGARCFPHFFRLTTRSGIFYV
ncbi:MAG: fumarate hydratase C-terminal domain-containing protein [Comamonadaceae bacterium]|nr:fumarate hydratase C-terminal domain-containing protein [Comamonadaceae bacterium]